MAFSFDTMLLGFANSPQPTRAAMQGIVCNAQWVIQRSGTEEQETGRS